MNASYGMLSSHPLLTLKTILRVHREENLQLTNQYVIDFLNLKKQEPF